MKNEELAKMVQRIVGDLIIVRGILNAKIIMPRPDQEETVLDMEKVLMLFSKREFVSEVMMSRLMPGVSIERIQTAVCLLLSENHIIETFKPTKSGVVNGWMLFHK